MSKTGTGMLAGTADEKQLHISTWYSVSVQSNWRCSEVCRVFRCYFRNRNLERSPKKELLKRANVAPSVLNGLVDKKIFEIYYHEIGRLNKQEKEVVELNALNEFQQRAHDEIVQSFQEKNVCVCFME